MALLKLALILFVAFAITTTEAIPRRTSKNPCGKGRQPLAGYFCGRGPTRQDCPSGYQCIIAPNDAYAVCCPLRSQTTTTTTTAADKPGSCPPPSTGVGICIARCTYDSDCQGNLKCCGGCPRECVAPVL